MLFLDNYNIEIQVTCVYRFMLCMLLCLSGKYLEIVKKKFFFEKC